MKKLFLFFFLSWPLLIVAQSFGNLTIFSENGDKFYLILDGKKQNEIAQSNIRIQQLPDLYYSAKIVFEDASMPPILKNNLYVSDADDVMRDAIYRLRRDKAGKPKLIFYSMLPVDPNFLPDADMYVFNFGQPAIIESGQVAKKKSIPQANASSLSLASLHIFSQDNDKFFLFLDGVKQNDIARSDIRISGIPDLYYDVKIVFEKTSMPSLIKNNLFVSDTEDKQMDAAYRIRRDKQGKPKLNFYSMTARQEQFVAPEGMYTFAFVNPADIAQQNKTSEPIVGTISNIKITESTVGDASPNVAISDISAKPKTTEKSNPIEKPSTGKTGVVATANPDLKTIEVKENKKCDGWPMGKGDLAYARKIIEDLSKEEEKLLAAQEIIASNCLLTSQVTEFCSLFKTEKSKLAFAKYAYQFTLDRKNYSAVNNALTLETSKKELNRFINGG